MNQSQNSASKQKTPPEPSVDAEQRAQRAEEKIQELEKTVAELKSRTAQPESQETTSPRGANGAEASLGESSNSIEDLRAEPMMAHLMDSLEAGKDIGHYGRLV